MDNFRIDITAEGEETLSDCLRIAFRHNAPGGKATHYKAAKLAPDERPHWPLRERPDGVPTLILFWHEESGAVALPAPAEPFEVERAVTGWLKHADFGKEPDHDGSNDHGWRVFTECWGHVAGSHYAICAIQPAWAMYGK